MILGISLFAPAEAIGKAVVAAIGKAVASGMSSFADWAVKGMVHAMVATTQVSFTGWFAGPWRGMVAVAAFLSVPILLAGTIQAVLAGQPGEAAKRAFVAPFQVAAGVGVGLAVATGILQLVDAACVLLVRVALGGDIGSAFSRIPTDLAAVTGAGAVSGPAGLALPAVAAFLLAGLAGLAAMVIWVELLLRSLLVYLVVAFVPLGLAGLFWRETSRWLRRLIEFGAAVALSQLVIVAVMTMAAADLEHGGLKGGSPGGDINTVITGIGLLILGSFALPLALKVVPHAAEAAVAAGVGGRVMGRTGALAHSVSDVGRFASSTGQGQVESASGPGEQPAPATGEPDAASGASIAGPGQGVNGNGRPAGSPPSPDAGGGRDDEAVGEPVPTGAAGSASSGAVAAPNAAEAGAVGSGATGAAVVV